MNLLLERYVLFVGVALSTFFGFWVCPARAESPGPDRSGFYQYEQGGLKITALYDGYVELDIGLFKGMDFEGIAHLLKRDASDRRRVEASVNAFLVETGGRLILVDTGAEHCFGSKMGQTLDHLRASGYAPEAIGTIVLTHLHPDHVCGLLDKEGKRAFPKADVWADKEDADAWLGEAGTNAAPEGNRAFFETIEPYQTAGHFHTFSFGVSFLPGLKAMPTPGHTFGHTSFLFESKAQEVLVWGDIVHNAPIQFPHPEVSLAYDTDQGLAAKTRLGLLKRASEGDWLVAGAHLPFPGLGHVRKEGEGFVWIPVGDGSR